MRLLPQSPQSGHRRDGAPDLALVFGIALLGVNSIRSLDTSVNHEISLLLESTDLGNGLVSSVSSEIRSAEQYLARPNLRLRMLTIEDGDSAYAYQRRYRSLGSLTTADRYIVNKIAANQAQIEVAYAMAHALTDLGRPDEARRMADLARGPSDTLLGDVRALGLAQTTRASARAEDLRRQADNRRSVLWGLFLASLARRRGDLVLDRPLGRPSAEPADRRGRAVRRWRPAPDPARFGNADRD